MRVVPESLQSSLDSGTTTLARCWQIIRSDGVQLGFTDHDLPLTFDGLVYEPESGFIASSVEARHRRRGGKRARQTFGQEPAIATDRFDGVGG
ncbi:MAG: DUF2163 domain-containing protein, partial [Pseudomonadota bacterium]